MSSRHGASNQLLTSSSLLLDAYSCPVSSEGWSSPSQFWLPLHSSYCTPLPSISYSLSHRDRQKSVFFCCISFKIYRVDQGRVWNSAFSHPKVEIMSCDIIQGHWPMVRLAVWSWDLFERSSHQSVHVKKVTPLQWRLGFEPAINFKWSENNFILAIEPERKGALAWRAASELPPFAPLAPPSTRKDSNLELI